MACSNSLLPVSTNKRKRFLDGDVNVIRKTMKTGEGVLGKDASSRLALRIVTDIPTIETKSPSLEDLLFSAGSDDADSLFDEPPPRISTPEVDQVRSVLTPKKTTEDFPGVSHLAMLPARRTAPPISGLYFDPSILLPEDLQEEIMWKCIREYFQEGTANQVMLFERAAEAAVASSASSSSSSNVGASTTVPSPTRLPTYLSDLLSLLHDILRPLVPPETHELLFSPTPSSHSGPPRARQAIINLYWPGEGITPHVDLLSRYGDGIIGVSLGSGCAMEFAKVTQSEDAELRSSPALASEERCALFLPKGSVVVLTKAARYDWTHGIEKRLDDLVKEESGSTRSVLLERDVRLSVTFRWMLPGAEVVGPSHPE